MFDLKKIIGVFLFLGLGCFLIPFPVEAQPKQDAGQGQGMTGGGSGLGSMTGPGMMGSGSAPPVIGRMGAGSPRSLQSMLHRWGRLFYIHRGTLGLTDAQMAKIDALVRDHWKLAIRNNADRQILLLDLQDLLTRPQVDMAQAQKKIRDLHSLEADLDVEGARTLENESPFPGDGLFQRYGSSRAPRRDAGYERGNDGIRPCRRRDDDGKVMGRESRS